MSRSGNLNNSTLMQADARRPYSVSVSDRLATPTILLFVFMIFPATFAVGPIVLNLYRTLLLFAFVPLVINWASGRHGPILPTDIFLLLYAFWVTVAIAFWHGAAAIEFGGINLLECFGAYLIGRVCVGNAAQFEAMIRWYGIAILLTLPFAIFETLTGRALMSTILAALPIVNGPPDAFSDVRLGLQRVQGPFETPIHYGIFCSFAFALTYVVGGAKRKRGARMLWALMPGLGTFLSLSSGALIALVMQIGFIGWNWIFSRVSSRWRLLTMLAVAAYIFVELFANRPPLSVFVHYTTFNSGTAWWRIAVFEAGMKNVAANPVFGLGLNDWIRPAWMHSSSVDNFWLLTTMRFGIPGFCFLAIAFATAFWKVSRPDLRDNETLGRCRRGWFMLMASLIIVLCTVHVWTAVYALVFFLLGSGMWMATVRVQEPEAKPDTSALKGRGMRRDRLVRAQGGSQRRKRLPHHASQ